MPSQKQSKRSRHVPPPPHAKAPTRVPAPPSATASGRRASPKVLLIAGGVLVAAIIAGVLAVSLSGGSSGSSNVPAVGSLTNALPDAAGVNTMFRGIPQDGNVLGSPNAPVTLVEYVDLQCPYCREFEATVLPAVVKNYVRTGKVKIDQRILAFIGPDSVSGRKAALAAGLQGKQFNLTELLYFNQGTENTGWLDQSMIDNAAASIPGVQVPMLLSSAKSGAIQVKADAAEAQAKADNVSSTPTLLVGHTGTTPHEVALNSPTDSATLTAAIRGALRG